MEREFFDNLLSARERVVFFEQDKYRYRLARFDQTSMAEDAIPGTPFRAFESVPQGRPSKRKQNDGLSFDAYTDTLFDYPAVVKHTLRSDADALASLNWHLSIQIPECGFNCWHCYNPKGVCALQPRAVTCETHCISAKEILDSFVTCKRAGEQAGRQYNILRVTGGEPFLAPELIAELLEEIGRPDADKYYPKAIWTETNLTPWAALADGRSVWGEANERAEKQSGLKLCEVFRKHRDRLIVHPCFHGLTDANLQACTDTKGVRFSDLMDGFRRLVEVSDDKPLNIYPTFLAEACDPGGIEQFFAELKSVREYFPLRVAIVSIDYYGPVRQRVESGEHRLTWYSRHASLHRWNELLRRNYGVAYAQTLRPLAEAVASQATGTAVQHATSDYRPALFLLKSVLRREYRQELLTILGAPPGTEVVSSYDRKHLESSLCETLRAGTLAFGDQRIKVLILFGNPKASEDQLTYLPMREAILKDVKVTEQIVVFYLVLGDYLVLSNRDRAKHELTNFAQRMKDYFGAANLLKSENPKWVLLGEESVLQGWDKSPRFEKFGHSNHTYDETRFRSGWDHVLDITKMHFPDLRDRGVFIQLVPQEGLVKELERACAIPFLEGNLATFRVRFFIPDFEHYDKPEADAGARTLSIRSSSKALRVFGYEPRPLAKYGELTFGLACDELGHDMPASVILEGAKHSPYCPRIELEFQLKKALASGC